MKSFCFTITLLHNILQLSLFFLKVASRFQCFLHDKSFDLFYLDCVAERSQWIKSRAFPLFTVELL